jgi:hypothetical protein
MMFNTVKQTVQPEDQKVSAEDRIPLSHLELDLPAPTTGWLIELDRRGISVITDDIGRQAISRDDARRLITEKHENERRQHEVAARTEQAAIERDRQWRASIWGGAPAVEGVSAAALMLQADKDAQPRRRSVLQEALANSEGMTFHSLAPTPEDEAS